MTLVLFAALHSKMILVQASGKDCTFLNGMDCLHDSSLVSAFHSYSGFFSFIIPRSSLFKLGLPVHLYLITN